MRKSGNIWENLISCFRIFWENMGKSFLEVNLWWEILRNFGIFREIIISSLRIFVEILFWDILGNNRKNIPNGKNFSQSGQNGKSTNEKFWENMGLFRKTCRSKLVVGNFGIFREIIISSFMIFVEIPFWDILGNFGK